MDEYQKELRVAPASAVVIRGDDVAAVQELVERLERRRVEGVARRGEAGRSLVARILTILGLGQSRGKPRPFVLVSDDRAEPRAGTARTGLSKDAVRDAALLVWLLRRNPVPDVGRVRGLKLESWIFQVDDPVWPTLWFISSPNVHVGYAVGLGESFVSWATCYAPQLVDWFKANCGSIVVVVPVIYQREE